MVPNLALRLRRVPLITRTMFATTMLAVALHAADEPPPRAVIMTCPMSVPANATTKIRLRGSRLDDIIAVQPVIPDTTVQILGKGTAAVSAGLDAKRVGSTQIELELTAPMAVEQDRIPIKLLFPNDEVLEYTLRVETTTARIVEQEPNDGFMTAQSLPVPALVEGEIHTDRNVDVFVIEVPESSPITVSIQARQFGSGLDSLLTLYNAQQRVIAMHDDQPESVDSRITRVLEPGRYFIALQDANDHGGSAQPYRLLIHSTE